MFVLNHRNYCIAYRKRVPQGEKWTIMNTERTNIIPNSSGNITRKARKDSKPSGSWTWELSPQVKERAYVSSPIRTYQVTVLVPQPLFKLSIYPWFCACTNSSKSLPPLLQLISQWAIFLVALETSYKIIPPTKTVVEWQLTYKHRQVTSDSERQHPGPRTLMLRVLGLIYH